MNKLNKQTGPDLTDETKVFSANTELFYKANILYAITINPDDSKQYNKRETKNLYDRMAKVKAYINETMLCLPQFSIEYELYLELSEPSDSTFGRYPRIHVHGLIRFDNNKSINQWLLYEFYRIMEHNMICIKPIDNLLEWEKYCKKQQHIIKQSPITSSTTSLFPKGEDDGVERKIRE